MHGGGSDLNSSSQSGDKNKKEKKKKRREPSPGAAQSHVKGHRKARGGGEFGSRV